MAKTSKKWIAHWAPYVDRVSDALGLSIRIDSVYDWRCEVTAMSPTNLPLFELTLSHPSYAPTTTHIGGKGALLADVDTDAWFKASR